MPIKEYNADCCGCKACLEICPKKAISMEPDSETFLYPKISSDLCVNCGLCEKVCPINFDKFNSYDGVDAFIGKNKNESVNYNSSSGGAFTAIYEVYIEKGYKIYGAKYNGHFQVEHDCAKTIDECEQFRKSKYVQSNTNGCFSKIANQLKNNEKVLFSGVSCQVAALNMFLDTKKIQKNDLITVNILCHGVPSQTLFDAYIAEEEEKEACELSQYRFRNKQMHDGGVNSRSAMIEFLNGHSYIRTKKDDSFLRGYYSRLFYRPSCAVCKFTKKERISDITIADAWNIDKLNINCNPVEGISLILFNSRKGKQYLVDFYNKMNLEKVPSEWALNSQRLFRAPTLMHKNRDKFFGNWEKLGFRKAVFKYTKPSISQRFKSIIPKPIKHKIKHFLHR